MSSALSWLIDGSEGELQGLLLTLIRVSLWLLVYELEPDSLESR